MIDSFELQNELSAIANHAENYDIPHEDDYADKEPNELLEAAVETVAERSETILNEDVFDVYRYLLKNAATTPGVVMGKLLDSISSGLKAELDATMRDFASGDQDSYTAHKLPLDLYAFLLAWFALASDKVKSGEQDGPAPGTKPKRGRGGKAAGGRTNSRTARTETWSWQSQIPDTLKLILKALTLPTKRIWTSNHDRTAFLTALTKPAYRVSESEVFMKTAEIKQLVFDVLCKSAKDHGQCMTLQIHITQSLQFSEHMPEILAECLAMLSTKYDCSQAGEEVLRELAGRTFTAQENKTPRTVARFLVAYTELYPRAAHRQLALLLNQQDSDAYPLRQAVLEILGLVIRERIRTDDGTKKKLDQDLDPMFDQIYDRLLDNSAWVRTKIFSVLSRLCDIEEAHFFERRPKMANLAVLALDDKVASVRKAALSLLIKLMESNPYGVDQRKPGAKREPGTLLRSHWMPKLEKAKEELKRFKNVGDSVANPLEPVPEQPERSTEDMDVDETQKTDEGEATEEDEPDSMSVDGDAAPRPRKLKPRKSQVNVAAINEEQQVMTEADTLEYTAWAQMRKVFKNIVTFILIMESSIDTVVKLLGSKNKAEVLEAIDFFKVGFAFQLDGVDEGIKKMIHLIWTKDNNTTTGEDGKEIKGIRQKLLECYKFLYFERDERIEVSKQNSKIAKALIELTYDATLATLTSLEEMLRIMMEEGSIEEEVVAKLWTIYSTSQRISSDQRTGAIIILGMLGVAKPDTILVPNKDTMLKVGLGKMGKSDLKLARYTCVALQRLNGSTKKVKGSLEHKTIRYSMDDPIFQRLLKTVIHPSRSIDWFGLTEQVINTVYALGEHPAEFCNTLIKHLAQRVWNNPRSTKPSAAADPAPTQTDEAMDEAPPLEDEAALGDATQATDFLATQASAISSAPSQAPKQSDDAADAFEMSQLFFVVGHVAIKQTVFMELVEREWKRQREVKQAEENAANADANKSKKDKEADELDQVAGNAEDEIGDRIAAMRENELLFAHDSLLGVFAPMIVQICGSPHKFKNRTLRAACHLSLCKLLCVSSIFTERHHRLLFKILETSRDPNIRANSVIALGDVAVSFNNIIDENSADLYKGLLDADPRVKKTTLMVLTHLILNGMIKVKGQLGEMAKCVEDEDDRIQDLAKLFFQELSTKENAIYNNLPDIISHLSSGANATDEEKFESTMKYIFTFIEKEKQAESIVDKLCQRFKVTEEPRQWRDIAFCLSLLPFKSERSLKKLIEGLPFYRDRLHEPKVFERFQDILTKARANKSKDKPDAELDEFEKILEEHKTQGEEDQALQNRVAKKAKKRAKAIGKGRKKAAAAEEEEEEA